ncbi:DUF4943 domain-containing protein [bacterium]|nr:DUF4943 domain-containing protein [bacterium]
MTARCLACCYIVLVFAFPASIVCSQEKGAKRIEEVKKATPVENTSNEKVEALFDSFRDKTYHRSGFPDLSFEDIPALLDLGESEQILKSFPRSPISSQFEATCSEGMIALWLVEGIRSGKKFPSLNALCFKKGQTGNDWTSNSESNHELVLDAYQQWWNESKDLPVEEAKLADPLLGMELHWH